MRVPRLHKSFVYNSLIRFKVEYASLVLYTNNILQNQCLISVENNFLRYLYDGSSIGEVRSI